MRFTASSTSSRSIYSSSSSLGGGPIFSNSSTLSWVMLMILSCIFHFQALILYQILTLCFPLLTPFMLGFLLTVFLLILPKTEYLLQGNPQQRSKLVSSSIFFRGNTLTPSDKCRNLEVIFDRNLTFKNHISDVCRSSFYHIRQLRQIPVTLDTNSSILLANALVSSKLDYYNSLFYNLPAKFLNRLQLV